MCSPLDGPNSAVRGAWGAQIARYLRLESAPALRTTSFTHGQFAVTRLVNATDRPGLSEPIPPEDAFLCELQLARPGHHALWRRGERLPDRAYEKDSIRILDLRDAWRVDAANPLDALSFYLPRSVLDEFAAHAGAPRIEALACAPGLADPLLAHLGAALLPALARPLDASALFVEHMALAVSAHILRRYGLLAAPSGALPLR